MERHLQQQSLPVQAAILHQVRVQLYQAVTRKLQCVPRQERELIQQRSPLTAARIPTQKLQQYQRQVTPTVLLHGHGAGRRLQQQSLPAQAAILHQVRRQLYSDVLVASAR